MPWAQDALERLTQRAANQAEASGLETHSIS
jgi:hypothetical protein